MTEVDDDGLVTPILMVGLAFLIMGRLLKMLVVYQTLLPLVTGRELCRVRGPVGDVLLCFICRCFYICLVDF